MTDEDPWSEAPSAESPPTAPDGVGRIDWGDHELGPDWFTVYGDSRIGQPVDFRLAIVRGRPRVIGIRIDNRVEITADVLRKIRLGELVDGLTSEYASERPDINNMPGVKFKERESFLLDWATWQGLFDGLERIDPGTVPTRRGVAPSEDQLRAFAESYKEQFRARPRGALTRTAAAFPMARSTAYRWLELCRDRGFISTEETP